MQDASQLPGGLLLSGGQPVTYDSLASGVNSGALNYFSGPTPTSPTNNLGGATVDYAAQQAAAQQAAQTQANQNYVNTQFDGQIAGLQNQMSVLDPQRQASQNQVNTQFNNLSLIHISEPTRPCGTSRMPSSA